MSNCVGQDGDCGRNCQLGTKAARWPLWNGKFNRGRSGIRRTYGAIADLARAGFGPQWRDPATREATTDVLIASGPTFASVTLARWMRSDSVVLAVMRRIPGDPREIEVRSAWGAMTVLGPRLRTDPRLQLTLRALGYPSAAKARDVADLRTRARARREW